MKTPAKFLIVLAVAAAAVAAVALKKNKPAATSETNATSVVATPNQTSSGTVVTAKLPMLRDLGAGKCIPCKLMAPILAELKKEYAGRMNVEFIDVWENPDAGKQYGVEMIPTQIFYDAAGKELFRHTGFFGKEDILGKWKELGVDLAGLTASSVVAGQTTNQVIAYYFHGTVRCDTCLKIERLGFETLKRQFAPELSAQRLAFLPVNYDEPGNQGYLAKYQLPCPSLVLVRREAGIDGQWKLLGETWQLIEDTNKFSQYVGDAVGKFLRGEN